MQRAHDRPPSRPRAGELAAARARRPWRRSRCCSSRRWRSTCPTSVRLAPGAQQLGRGRVPQPVRADRREPGALGRRRDDAADRASTPIARCGASARHEHRAVQRARRPPATQIAGQRAADIDRQGQPIIAVALAIDHHLAGTPVDVIERQAGDLAAAQPEPAHQHQDREIAPPDRSAPVAARQQPVATRRAQAAAAARPHATRPTPGTAPVNDRSISPSHVQEPQQRPQRGRDRPDRRPLPRVRLSQHERAHISRRHPIKLETVTDHEASQRTGESPSHKHERSRPSAPARPADSGDSAPATPPRRTARPARARARHPSRGDSRSPAQAPAASETERSTRARRAAINRSAVNSVSPATTDPRHQATG